MLNASFCYFHNPEVNESDKQKNRATGGKNNATKLLETQEPLDIQGTKDVVVLKGNLCLQLANFGRI